MIVRNVEQVFTVSYQTLFTVGSNAAYIHYRSDLEPAHKFYWDRFYHNLANFIGVDMETAANEMAAQPPDWIPIHMDEHLRYLQKPDVKQENRILLGRLLRKIATNHRYTEIGRVGRWLILKRTVEQKT